MKRGPFKNITIVGVGLVGGSLGLAIRRRFPHVRVVGVDKRSVLIKAKRRGAIAHAEGDLAKGIHGADLIILATPLTAIFRILPQIAKLVPPTTIVTDVAGVKLPVMNLARKHFAGNFIGGHPMAGIELSGIGAAHPLLFENALYVLTSTRRTSSRHLKALADFLAGLGARPLAMDARMHDRVASAISHVPQLAAVGMMRMAGKRHPEARRYLQLAAGGFRDLTRIASSRYDLWDSLLKANRREVIRSIDMVLAEWKSMRRSMTAGSLPGLKKRFQEANRLRRAIPKDMKGFLTPLAAIHVFVPDKPGMLARMTAAIARHRLNIKDIELMKIREGTGGTFRLFFESREIAQRAAAVLKKKGFETEE